MRARSLIRRGSATLVTESTPDHRAVIVDCSTPDSGRYERIVRRRSPRPVPDPRPTPASRAAATMDRRSGGSSADGGPHHAPNLTRTPGLPRGPVRAHVSGQCQGSGTTSPHDTHRPPHTVEAPRDVRMVPNRAPHDRRPVGPRRRSAPRRIRRRDRRSARKGGLSHDHPDRDRPAPARPPGRVQRPLHRSRPNVRLPRHPAPADQGHPAAVHRGRQQPRPDLVGLRHDRRAARPGRRPALATRSRTPTRPSWPSPPRSECSPPPSSSSA